MMKALMFLALLVLASVAWHLMVTPLLLVGSLLVLPLKLLGALLGAGLYLAHRPVLLLVVLGVAWLASKRQA